MAWLGIVSWLFIARESAVLHDLESDSKMVPFDRVRFFQKQAF